MRAYMGVAALVVALGFALSASAGPVVVTGNSTTVKTAKTSFFTSFHLPSFVRSPSKFASFFPPMPSIAFTSATATSEPVPMKNGVPTADYFKRFNLQAAPRAQ
jgi:hypothetical protein